MNFFYFEQILLFELSEDDGDWLNDEMVILSSDSLKRKMKF